MGGAAAVRSGGQWAEQAYEAMAPVVSELFFGGLAAVQAPPRAKRRRKQPQQKETLA